VGREPAVAARFAHGYQTTLAGHTRDVCRGALDLGVDTSVWGTFWGDGGVGATAGGLARFTNASAGG
jgi:CubicO group peptidase (beta-lactamase class C family)